MKDRKEVKEALDSFAKFTYMYQSMFFNEYHKGSNELVELYFCGHHVMYRHTIGLNMPVLEDVMLYNDFIDWIVRAGKTISGGN